MRPGLTDRLRDIVGRGRPAAPPAVPVRGPSLGGDVADATGPGDALDADPAGGAPAGLVSVHARHVAGDARLQRAAAALGGRAVRHREGLCVLVERDYAPGMRHGRSEVARIAAGLREAREGLALIARAWPSRHPAGDGQPAVPDADGLCVLDLETTGLAGGAGTQAFLVGCAVLDGDGVHVRQYLLAGYEHERAQLALAGEWLAARQSLVTFNGRSFDVPLVEMRFAYHRLPCALGRLPHVDVLHPARRLWRDRPSPAGPHPDESSCTLAVLERRLGGVHRVGDVPGFEIPARYFQFARDLDARPMEAVLEHNRLDLLSTLLVLARAAQLALRGPAATAHARECLGLGRLFERADRPTDAEACFAHAAQLAGRVPGEGDACAEALRRLAVLRRRAGRLDEAAEAWRHLLATRGAPGVLRREAREALAVYHEHRSKDLASAREFALDLLGEVEGTRHADAVRHRLTRLDRKLDRSHASLFAAGDSEVD
jgi:uncharacterized protein YprB with RNaseH-like and TPR domain